MGNGLKAERDYDAVIYMSPDGRLLVEHSQQRGQARVWNLETGRLVLEATGDAPTSTPITSSLRMPDVMESR